MRIFIFFLFLAFNHVYPQTISQKLLTAVKKFEADSQMRHAIMGFYVIDAKTGKELYSHNAGIGLAAASTQKLFTSGAAFEMLGPGFRYSTSLGYAGKIENGILNGNLIITGSGDPTLGSWRYTDTKEDTIINTWVRSIEKLHLKQVKGYLTYGADYWAPDHEKLLKWVDVIPDGWIWQDIGNYYGAASEIVNWRENQYDLILRPGKKTGDSVTIVGTKPILHKLKLASELTTGEKNSGDNSFIYLPVLSETGTIRGTIPAGENDFIVSGSMPSPGYELIMTLKEKLQHEGIGYVFDYIRDTFDLVSYFRPHIISEHFSPTLDSINYWFLKKSINLYGEALIKTIGWEKGEEGSTEKGIELVKDFWSKHGIDKAAINIIDGSGLSPQNRVTAEAEVQVLQYAKKRPWYNSFYNSLPEINGMKMKSGAIGGARAYAGYQTAKNGAEYVFSIIVNNYDGSSTEIVKKIYKLLDELK